MDDNIGPSVVDAMAEIRADLIKRCEFQRELYEESLNPLYAWNALAIWAAAAVTTCRADIELPEGHLRTAAFEMPHWLVLFLMRTAGDIQSLAMGLHPSRSDEDVPPRKQAALLPLALDFLRPGWNAFVEYAGEEWAAQLRELYWTERAAGRSRAEALQTVMEAHGTVDERTARRAMSGRRRKGQKPR